MPAIIKVSGKTPVTETLADAEYIKMLNCKLQDEVKEYLEIGSVEEPADIGEVMHSILAYKSISTEEFQNVRMEKLQERSGFAERLRSQLRHIGAVRK